MGTNYYIMTRKDYELQKKLDEVSNTINYDTLREKVKEVVDQVYNALYNILSDNYEYLEMSLKEDIDEHISDFISKMHYGLDYSYSLFERKTKHIGKSSAGWLFNFQFQDEWHTYLEFKKYILDKEIMKDKVIINEYMEEVTAEEMLDLVDTKQNDPRNLANPDNFKYCSNISGYRFSDGDFS